MCGIREYTEENVQCKSKKNWLRGTLVRPNKTGKVPVVMMFHGFCVDKDEQGKTFEKLARKFAEQGIASVRFNFAGTADSDGEFCDMTINTEAEDAEAVLTYVKGLDFADPDKIGAMGMSMGGVVCSILAGRYPDEIARVCLWAPAACLTDDAKNGSVRGTVFDAGNPPETLTFSDGLTIGRRFITEAADIDIYEIARGFQKKVLILQGDMDPIVSLDYAKRYLSIYEDSSLKLIPGAGHGFWGREEEQIHDLTVGYFAKELQYPILFTPLHVGNMILKNRIVAAPITKYGILPSPVDELELIASKARGGAGLVILGSCAVEDENSLIYYEASSLDGAKRPLYNEEISVIHQYGAKVSIQLLHCGMWADLRGKEGSPVGPDTIVRQGKYQGLDGVENNQIMDGRTIRGLDKREMEKICRQYARAAQTAKKMGVDMVMLHFAHGWLPAEFLSPFFNHRTDEYGGSFENRIRFPMQIVKAVREAVGRDYPIEMRIGAEEYVENGLHPEEVIEFLKRVEDMIDMVHISSGLDKFVEQTTYIESPSLYPHQINVKYARLAKQVLKIPVITVGGITMPDEAEEILERGDADGIALGRALIADPQWAEKARTGNSKAITACLRCCSCYGVATEGISQGCAVNPESGRALRLKTEEMYLSKEKRQIVVIGGGPAGMQAAVTAAERGHRVTLFEKEDELGGLLRISDKDLKKIDMKNFKNSLIHRICKENIELRLGEEATPEKVKMLHPDRVIVAVGSSPVLLKLPGMNSDNVLDILEAHERESELGKAVAIIGAGASGCELALSLAEDDREIYIIEQSGVAASAGNILYRGALDICLREHSNIHLLLNTELLAVTENGVKISSREQGIREIPADHVVCAVGMRANRTAAEAFLKLDYDVCMIGDCVSPRRINEAVHEGFFAGWRA